MSVCYIPFTVECNPVHCLKGHQVWPVILLQAEASAQVALELRLEG